MSPKLEVVKLAVVVIALAIDVGGLVLLILEMYRAIKDPSGWDRMFA